MRRHTRSPWARLQLAGDGQCLRLTSANAGRPDGDASFEPSSLTERVRGLSGMLRVEHGDADETRVCVSIPL